MKLFVAFGFSTFLIVAPLAAKYCAPDQDSTFLGRMRASALVHLDDLLNWSNRESLRTYLLKDPLNSQVLHAVIPELEVFEVHYGYFSPIHPLISRVSRSSCDLIKVANLVQLLTETSDSAQFAMAEIITKALAYRDLEIGQKILIPFSGRLESYTVDHVFFDLWHKMPAFGLVPDRPQVPSILLFRGTDLSLDKERGWASMLTDLDMAGPGVSVFMKAQPDIHRWLEKVAVEDKKAIVLGFSLGGVLAAYTYIYEYPLLSELPSISFNAPGISRDVLVDVPEGVEQRFIAYVNRGDLISKVGKLFGKVFEVSTDEMMKPIYAHTVLMSAHQTFTLSEVAVRKENARRSR